MDPEPSRHESKHRVSWTQTSRPCTPVDILATREYIGEDPVHFPPLVQFVSRHRFSTERASSSATPHQTGDPKEQTRSLTKPLQTEHHVDNVKYTPVPDLTGTLLTKTGRDSLQTQQNVQSDLIDSAEITQAGRSAGQALRELNTTPISFFSKGSAHSQSQVSGHSLQPQTKELGMSSRETPIGSSLPVANLKRDAMLVRNFRNKRSIADLNALRNKFISYDQYRLTKRVNVPSKFSHLSTNSIPQLSIGDFDFEKSPPRQYSTQGRHQESETRPGPRYNSTEPRRKEFTLTRSRTYAGPARIDEAYTRETEQDGILCEVKGLHKESPQLNHNTPHAELLSPRDTDRTKMPNLNKYFSSPSPDTAKMVALAVGNGVTVDNQRKTVKSSGQRFRQKKENSKLVLKFYSEGKTKPKESLQLSQDASFSNSSSVRQTCSDTPKDKSLKENAEESELRKAGFKSSDQTGPHVVKPTTLTAKNLEIFDHLTSTAEKSKCERVSEESDSEVNARVMDWLAQGKLLNQEQMNGTFRTSVNKQVIPVAP